jgi:hypothetical protein
MKKVLWITGIVLGIFVARDYPELFVGAAVTIALLSVAISIAWKGIPKSIRKRIKK